MGFVLGLNAKLYRNTGTYGSPTWNEIPNVKDVTLSLEKGETDATTRGNGGWEAVIATLKKASIEFNMVWDTADQDLIALRDAWLGDTVIEFAVMDGDINTPGNQGLRASCMVTKFSRKEPLEEALMAEVSIKPSYSAFAPSWYTVPE